jgi:hypothetical protein
MFITSFTTGACHYAATSPTPAVKSAFLVALTVSAFLNVVLLPVFWTWHKSEAAQPTWRVTTGCVRDCEWHFLSKSPSLAAVSLSVLVTRQMQPAKRVFWTSRGHTNPQWAATTTATFTSRRRKYKIHATYLSLCFTFPELSLGPGSGVAALDVTCSTRSKAVN